VSKNDITGDSIITKVTGDREAFEKGMDAIFGKRDFRNRPIKEEEVTETKDEDKVGR
jgi:hypothetical protein